MRARNRFVGSFTRWLMALAAALALIAPLAPAATPAALAGSTGAGSGSAPSGSSDYLYVGDIVDNTVKRFDAASGQYLGTFVASGSNGLDGPMGMIFTRGDLYLSNQNFGGTAGEIMTFDGTTGAFLGAFNQNPPYAPRGIIAGLGHTIYVADIGDVGLPGKVSQYDSKTGAWLGDLVVDTSRFTAEFHPRALVIGPDGLLYVSARALPEPSAGYILRFDLQTNKMIDVFASDQGAGCAGGLHRPEGIVFGPNGNLYVTAFTIFSGDPSDTDKVLIFNPKTGACTGQINLDQAGGDRAFAQALLFGPGGYLFVPITGNGPDTGSVRRYNVANGSYTVFVPPVGAGGPLNSPFYLTFRNTNPSTLAYGQ